MLKSITFIVLTTFFQFNELKILRQPGSFFKLNQKYFFTVQDMIVHLGRLWFDVRLREHMNLNNSNNMQG